MSEPDDEPRKKRLGTIALGLLSVVVGVIVAEIGLRYAYPRSELYLTRPPNIRILFEPTDQLHGVEGVSVYETNSLGIRGPELSETDEYRILSIGGSTTENVWLDASESWTTRLGPSLSERTGTRVWSGDIGRSGHTLRGHLLQLRHFVPQVESLDAVVMLLGVNDLSYALSQAFDWTPRPPLSDPDVMAAQMLTSFEQVPGRIHDRVTYSRATDTPWLKQTAVYGLLRVARAQWERRSAPAVERIGDPYLVWREHRSESAERVDSLPDLAGPIAEYREVLEAVADEADELGMRLILMTAPAMWRDEMAEDEESLLWLGGIGDFQSQPGHPYFTTRALREALDAFNAELLAICDERDLECLDLAPELPQDRTSFVDDVHMTELGSRLVSEALADYFASRPPFGDPGA